MKPKLLNQLFLSICFLLIPLMSWADQDLNIDSYCSQFKLSGDLSEFEKELLEAGLIESEEFHRCAKWYEIFTVQGRPRSQKSLREKIRQQYELEAHTLWDEVAHVSDLQFFECMAVTQNIDQCMCMAKELPVYMSYVSYINLVLYGSNYGHENLTPEEFGKLEQTVDNARLTCLKL